MIQEHRYDVVIVGAGGAGMVTRKAAIIAEFRRLCDLGAAYELSEVPSWATH